MKLWATEGWVEILTGFRLSALGGWFDVVVVVVDIVVVVVVVVVVVLVVVVEVVVVAPMGIT